jgi:hypothetical protein
VQPHVRGSGNIVPPDPSKPLSGLSSIFASVERLIVHDTDLVISSRRSTGRPHLYPLDHPMLKFVPNLSNLEFKIPGCHPDLSEVMSADRIVNAIVEPYSKAIKPKVWKLIASIDLLGRKTLKDLPMDSRVHHETNFQRLRPARVIVSNQIQPFNFSLGSYQQLIRSDTGRGKHAFPDETIELYIMQRDFKDPVILTQKYLFVCLSQERKVDLNLRLKNVISVDLEVNDVVVTSSKPNQVTTCIQCWDFATAEQVATYISSRRFALNFGK